MIQRVVTEPEKWGDRMRCGIVGCGGVAQVHAKAIHEIMPGALIAVADIVPEKAQELANKYGAKAYSSLGAMLCSEQIDVLHICTPHHLHVPMTVAALKVGTHVFMEKPPVIDEEQWDFLQRTLAQKKISSRLGICFQNRYNDSVQFVKKELESGKYGRILGVRGIVTWHRDQDYYYSSNWRGKLATEGGGALMNQAIHTLDLIQYFIKEKPLSVKAVKDKLHLPEDIEVEDLVAAHITYPRARASFYVTTGYVKDVPPLIELECEKGRLRIEEDLVTIFADGEAKLHSFTDQKRLGKSHWGMGHLTTIKEFYACLKENRKFAIEMEDVADTIWLLLRIYGKN